MWDCNRDGRNSGQSEPQMHISKEGDPYLRTLLVQGAHHILGPFGADSDLRRWGLKLAERGGKNGKKRAIIATARKLAVLLHRLWVSGEVYEPLHNSSQSSDCRPQHKVKNFHRKEKKSPKPSSGDCVNRLAQLPSLRWNDRSTIRWQHRLKREHPTCTERNKIAHRECGWKGGDSVGRAAENGKKRIGQDIAKRRPPSFLAEWWQSGPRRQGFAAPQRTRP